jgi:hypothetical protein
MLRTARQVDLPRLQVGAIQCDGALVATDHPRRDGCEVRRAVLRTEATVSSEPGGHAAYGKK